MGLINAEGYYHGTIIDGGLSQSTNGFPQEVMALRATEVYDQDSDSYLPWDADNAEITAYLILIDGKDRVTKSGQQVKKITGWDGANFKDLAEMNMADMPIGFRVAENTYKDNTTLQVSWVDTIDAPPFRTVQKLSAEDVTALQQRYASVLASTKAPTKAVSAKTTAAPAAATKPTTKPTAKAPAKPKTPAATKPKPPKTTVGKCTADDAYQACFSLKRDDVTQQQLDDAWLVAVAAVNEDESKITEEQWFGIKETLLAAVSKV